MLLTNFFDSKSIIAENTYHTWLDPHAAGGPHGIDGVPVALIALLLEVPTTAMVSIVPDLAARMESSVEAAMASIHHL
jgi:hypothetical protein